MHAWTDPDLEAYLWMWRWELNNRRKAAKSIADANAFALAGVQHGYDDDDDGCDDGCDDGDVGDASLSSTTRCFTPGSAGNESVSVRDGGGGGGCDEGEGVLKLRA